MDIIIASKEFLNNLYLKSKNNFSNGFSHKIISKLTGIDKNEELNVLQYLSEKGLIDTKNGFGDNIKLTAVGIDTLAKTRENKTFNTIKFKRAVYLPSTRDAIEFLFNYDLIDDIGESKPKKIKVAISGSLSIYWGFQAWSMNPNIEYPNLAKILLQEGKNIIVKKLKDRTLSDNEELRLLTTNSPLTCPYNPANLIEPENAEFEIEIEKEKPVIEIVPNGNGLEPKITEYSAPRRLAKVAFEFNISQSTLADFLNSEGIAIENKPTSKVSEEAYVTLLKKFTPDELTKERSDKLKLIPLIHKVDKPIESIKNQDEKARSRSKIIIPPEKVNVPELPYPKPTTKLSTPKKKKKSFEEHKEDNIANKIKALILGGENKLLEFKSTLRYDIKQGKPLPHIEHAVMKTIAAFLNTEGGTLLIGVDDDKNILGLEHDLGSFGKGGKLDAFSLHFDNLISNFLGNNLIYLIDVSYPRVENKILCVIKIKEKAPDDVWMKHDGEEKFYIRRTASTKELHGKEATSYIKGHWNIR